MISVTAPLWNEAENIDELVSRVVAALETTGEEFELLLVDNGSTDQTLAKLEAARAKDPRVKYVSLSRNFGHQGGVLAGLSHARGDAVITMDGDLQHPPELLPRMVELWKEGHEVVFTTKSAASLPRGWRSLFTRAFYAVLSLVTDVKLGLGQSDFRLLDRCVVDVIRNLPERRKFLRGLVQWAGYRQVGVEYEVGKRAQGVSKFSFWGYVSFAVDGILSLSHSPLRAVLSMGMLMAAISLCYSFVLVAIGISSLIGVAELSWPPGWATISVGVLFLSAVQLISIGVVGEYQGRVFEQTLNRPEYLVMRAELGPEPSAAPPSAHEADEGPAPG